MYLEENKLLSKKTRSLYNYGETKKEVEEIMRKYEEAKYKFSNIPQPSITPSYEFRYEQRTNSKRDPIGKFVEIKFDTEDEIDNLYEKLTNLTKEFNKDEAFYYANVLVKGKSEEYIYDLMNVTKNSIVPIKESCVIKIALVFGKAILK